VIVFLIDADNLCVPAWVEEAFRRVEKTEGRISVCRAYGSSEKLKGLASVLRDRSIRLFVNLSLTKNTTDVALAVDAMELACQEPKPKTVVIGSGDADFVPLVVRLRERGIRMVCASEFRKMAPEAVSAYDEVMLIRLEQDPEEAGSLGEAVPPVEVGNPPPTIKKVPAKKTTAKKVAEKKAPTKKKTIAASEKKKSSTATKVEVKHILDAVPLLKTGQPQPLGDVVKLLHDAKLLGKNAASTKLFKKFPHHFELVPAKQPNRVQYLLPQR
jgi:hypothetical protein